MTVNKQLSYDVHDSHGTPNGNKLTSISFRVNESAPKYLIHKTIVIQDRNRRQGTASCKTRSEVRGGGRKPWKQKGTGQARSGSSNSPLWNGGGVTFGPKPKTTIQTFCSTPKALFKMRRNTWHAIQNVVHNLKQHSQTWPKT